MSFEMNCGRMAGDSDILCGDGRWVIMVWISDRDLNKMVASVLGPALFLLVSQSQSARGSEYEIDGTIKQTAFYYSRGALPPVIHKQDFTVFVRDCAWLIQLRIPGKSSTEGAVEIGSTNGTEIFEVQYPKATSAQGASNSSRRFSVVLAYSNNAPIIQTDGEVVGHLWLMFASRCVLQSSVDHMLTPVFQANLP